MRPPVPPFTEETARQKVQAAEDAWNTRDPERVAAAYTEDSQWRNRDEFLNGRAEIVDFLTRKWARELDYALRKDLWAFTEDRIAVRFQYECRDASGRVADQRVLGADDEVRAEREVGAASDARAVHLGDDRLRRSPERHVAVHVAAHRPEIGRGIPRARQVALVHQRGRPLEVVAGAERAAGAAQADDPDGVVGGRGGERRVE